MVKNNPNNNSENTYSKIAARLEEELERTRLAAAEEKRKLLEELESRVEEEREEMKAALAELQEEKEKLYGDSQERVSELQVRMEEELKAAQIAKDEMEDSYREQMEELRASLEKVKAEAEDTRREIRSQNEEALAELQRQIKAQADEFEEQKHYLEAQYAKSAIAETMELRHAKAQVEKALADTTTVLEEAAQAQNKRASRPGASSENLHELGGKLKKSTEALLQAMENLLKRIQRFE